MIYKKKIEHRDAPSINLTIFSPIMTEFIDNIRSNFQKFLLPTIDRDNVITIILCIFFKFFFFFLLIVVAH